MGSFLNEVSEKTLVYHRSSYPMKVGDIITPKKDAETKNHWMESIEAEIGMEVLRIQKFPEKPSRLNCVYSSIVPRSRFTYKGNLYVVRPKGKIHVGDSGIIDELIGDFDDNIFGMTGNFERASEIRKEIKENPERALRYLNYMLATQYWEGKSRRGNFRAIKKNIEVLSEAAEVIEVIEDTNNDIKIGNEYEVTKSDKLFAWLQPSPDNKEDVEWNAFNNRVIEHLFSTIDKEKRLYPYEKMGYLNRGVKIKPREVRLTSTKSRSDITHPDTDTDEGKYSRISMGFEMDGRWYMPYENKDYTFDLVMAAHLRYYHAQPYDFGKYLRKI